MYLSIYLFTYLSICLSVCLSVCLSTCVSASLKTKLFCKTSSFFKVDNIQSEAILRVLLNVWTWQRQKRRNCARLLHFSKLTTPKTKQSWEISSVFELDNIQNKAILRDFLRKWKVECNADGLLPMRFPIFPLHSTCLKYCACHEKLMRAVPVAQNHLSKPTDLMLQNATRLRKSAPWPPNISDEHVFCIAPATRNTSLQILFNGPTPAIVFGNATKPSHFTHFWEGAQSLARATRNDIWTQKWREHVVLCTFWLGNVLRATMACTFLTSEVPKVVREWCVFAHFYLEMCFAPKRRAPFHLSSGQMAPHLPL